MKRIYTRTGDSGTTAIHGGLRVLKTDVRIEANGCIDELNVAIGIVRTSMPSDHEWQPLLKEIQLNLMTSMSLVATRSDMKEKNPNSLPDNLVELLEKQIDAINALCTPDTSFILPGGTPLASELHHTRVLARKAERWLWKLHEVDAVPMEILIYLNRLSDLFFIMSRYELQQSECSEEIWRQFGYKRKLK
ncbi:cob(I)yrinic acid a,c-diamide adenosyltransferase [Muribaculum sp. NM65_B17]|uniref:cob(I)yrinic acid a,c-diamide adenosyltransferase n=1 Tax=Muribaculum sp. NM65_B17 TaxID=2516961 RepID=UPI001093CC6D|nr:cob(I)yrinic acid a,c-diamide adenosyltransferase [Muribaculum sp. NM65_B17]TGY02684.1 cob(I)yrinic acid a,c-diamide adenosyltransferase [Muribaculum sp. NM65_B17]THG43514.1 cob(I)yrinic acid a,c-diamide adenosyltransferase [Muribaculaceae bacterium]